MILKKASFTFTDIKPLAKNTNNDDKMIRTASGRIMVEPGTEKAKIIEAEIKKHPNALFFRAKAIEANEPNSNGDYFSTEELKTAYKSFEGVPFFTNHDNENVENARGKVVFAEWDPDEESVYTISFVDRDAYPHICRSIEEEYVTGVSMGCSVEYSVCNICGNKAERTEDYCAHIRNRKGRTFSGRARNVKTGEEKTFRNEPVFEYNYGLKFIELSAVVDPACPNCHIEGIIPNDSYLSKVASMENDLRMIRTAAVMKKASQEEINQIEQCLETLEGIALNLIRNRKQVEMEFSSDLVQIMSDLQSWMEELIGAGYGNIESEIPGTVGNMDEESDMEEGMMEEGMMEEGMGEMPEQNAPPSPSPVSSQEDMGVGSVSGSPVSPPTSSPQLPITAPVKPRSANIGDSRSIQRVAGNLNPTQSKDRIKNGEEIVKKASTLFNKIIKNGDIEMGKRRTRTAKKAQKEEAIKVLSNSWEEKQSFFEYVKEVPSIQNNNYRLSVNKQDGSFIIVAEDKSSSDKKIWTYEDLTNEQRSEIKNSPKDAAVRMLDSFANSLNQEKEGVKKMNNEMNKKAGATTVQETPDQVQEKQLERSDLYHARQGDEKHEITQQQLESQRSGEKDEITEVQMDDGNLKHHPRANDAPDQITESQMEGDNRTEEEKHSITQRQLEEDGQKTGIESDTITEDQLNNTPSPWSRMANKDSSMFKSASDHMDSVIDTIAEASIKTGCTPDEACSVAASLVDSVESRYNLATSLSEGSKPKENIDYAKRVAYWHNKNLRVASAGTKEIAEVMVDGLRVHASDEQINPDVLIDAVDIVSDDKIGIERVSEKIEEKLEEAKEIKISKKSRKEELREALSKGSRKERDKMREAILASAKNQNKIASSENAPKILNEKAIGNANSIIETSFNEMGSRKDNPNFKKDVVAFAKGALASQNMRLASITNVTIDGDTIQIAVETNTDENEVNIDTGEGTTEIPGEGEPMTPEGQEMVPEGDMTGTGEGMPQESWASSKKSGKMSRTAQSPMGGGAPGAGGGVSAPGDSAQGLPGNTPAGSDPIQALTMGEEGEESADDIEIPSTGERQMPWTICPECGSSDVDVENDNGDIKGNCNSCGAEYEALIKKEIEFKIIKPTKSVGEEGVETPEEPETPEVPALPVAAQTSLGKDSIVRIAKNKEKHGHVCPACGQENCKTTVEANGHTEFSCLRCGTNVEKDLMVSASNPQKGKLRVQWDVYPDLEGCEKCKEEALKFASQVRVNKMLRNASANADQFPTSACKERIARKYGGNTVASFGPCKGKLLADCVCKELKRLGFRKVRHLNKFASASMEKDPWDECIDDQTKNEGHSIKEAEAICDCIKKRWASDDADNIYAQAFSEDVNKGIEKSLKEEDLATLHSIMEQKKAKAIEKEQSRIAMSEEEDIGSPLPPADYIEVEAQVIEVDENEEEDVSYESPVSGEVEIVEEGCPLATGEEDAPCEEIESPCESPESEIVEVEMKDEEKPNVEVNVEVNMGEEEDKATALAMNNRRIRNTNEEVFKMAKDLKKVDGIEDNVESGVPRSNQTIRNESGDNIDVPVSKPNVPRNKAEMGSEGPGNVNPSTTTPDVPIDSSYQGHEKEVQSDMPEINNEIKGTVIAGKDEQSKVSQHNRQAKKMKEVDSVEDDVEAGVPRSNETLGNESGDNIDVPVSKPNVPRNKAEMGNESDKNINPKSEAPDVPIDNAYQGHEKEVQSDMPEINDKMLKQVKQKRQVQLDRIAQARHNEAVRTASWLVANERVSGDRETFNAVIDALKGFETDQIPEKAERMFPNRTASRPNKKQVEASGHSIPAIVQESSSRNEEEDFTQKLSNSFTIGNSKFDKNLTIYGER